MGTFGSLRAVIILDEVDRKVGEDVQGDLREVWPLLTSCDTSHPRVIAHAAWDLQEAEAVFDSVPNTLEYDGKQDGADVFV